MSDLNFTRIYASNRPYDEVIEGFDSSLSIITAKELSSDEADELGDISLLSDSNGELGPPQEADILEGLACPSGPHPESATQTLANKIDKWVLQVEAKHKKAGDTQTQSLKKLPHVKTLLESWSPETAQAVADHSDFKLVDADLSVDQAALVTLAILGIPVYPDGLLESLHLLFLTYADASRLETPSDP